MEEKPSGLTLNQETMDVLVANIIPTTKYFESRFDHMQYQIDEIKKMQGNMQQDMDKRFETMQKQMDKRFEAMQEQMDKRFEQVDKRFEQVDKRFEQVNDNILKLTLKVEESIQSNALKFEQLEKVQEKTIRDYIIERDRYYDKKFSHLRLYNLATISLVAGVILKMAGVITL
jgi:exonuclease VII large subunit